MTDTITKLYSGMTNKERAALAFRYLTDVNELELERVSGAVPFKTYRCRDLEYQDRLDGLFNMAALYSIEYWRIYSRSLEALVASHVMANDSVKEQQMLEVQGIWQSRLMALNCAMLAVCTEHGIEPDSVRQLAEVETFVPMSGSVKPDTNYRMDMQENFGRLLKIYT